MTPPNMGDGVSFYLFQPWGTSLYRSDEALRQWLRVVPAGACRKPVFTKRIYGSINSTSGRILTDVVTTMDIPSYFRAVSYGSTMHVEAGIVKFGDLNGLSQMYESPDDLMTQAMLRHYEARLDTLVGIARDKVGCVFQDAMLCKSLVCEMRAVDMLWAQLMNVGHITPAGCMDGIAITSNVKAELPRVLEDRRQLKARLIYGNFVNIPFKIEGYQREALMSIS